MVWTFAGTGLSDRHRSHYGQGSRGRPPSRSSGRKPALRRCDRDMTSCAHLPRLAGLGQHGVPDHEITRSRSCNTRTDVRVWIVSERRGSAFDRINASCTSQVDPHIRRLQHPMLGRGFTAPAGSRGRQIMSLRSTSCTKWVARHHPCAVRSTGEADRAERTDRHRISTADPGLQPRYGWRANCPNQCSTLSNDEEAGLAP